MQRAHAPPCPSPRPTKKIPWIWKVYPMHVGQPLVVEFIAESQSISSAVPSQIVLKTFRTSESGGQMSSPGHSSLLLDICIPWLVMRYGNSMYAACLNYCLNKWARIAQWSTKCRRSVRFAFLAFRQSQLQVVYTEIKRTQIGYPMRINLVSYVHAVSVPRETDRFATQWSRTCTVVTG